MLAVFEPFSTCAALHRILIIFLWQYVNESYIFFDYFWDETLPITFLRGNPIKFHLPLIVGGGAFQHLRCNEITSHRFFEVMSAFTMFDEYFLKDLGNDQAIWAWHSCFTWVFLPNHQGANHNSQLPPFSLYKKGIREETTWRNTLYNVFELLFLSNFCCFRH